jgi:hypothetical protein
MSGTLHMANMNGLVTDPIKKPARLLINELKLKYNVGLRPLPWHQIQFWSAQTDPNIK